VGSVPLPARLVEVIADRGASAAARYLYGSGCIVRGRMVLTAAHVVAGAQTVQVRDPHKRLYSATVDPRFVGDADGPGPDLALVEIVDPSFADDLPPIGLAAIDRDSLTAEPVERCHAIGYPWFANTPSPTAVRRETVDAIGVLPVASGLAGGLLSLVVSVAPRPLPPEDRRLTDSEWAGMSGAPVVAAGRLVGVVIEHALRAGPSTITAVPLTALQYDDQHPDWGPGVADPPAWWSRLGGQAPAEWPRPPAPPAAQWEPAYRDRLREFGQTLHWRMPQLLGRQRELAEIAAFATGQESYRWLVGGAYAGKSALLYEAVTVGLPDEVDVVCYFLSRRASDASSERFLAAVVPQLAYLCGIDPPVTTRDEFPRLWRKTVEQAGRDRRHLLLAVDGLDEDLLPPGLPSVASLLPTLVGEHAHVLVASCPHPELPPDVERAHPLSHVEPVPLSPFKDAEGKDAEGLAELARKEVYDLTHGVDAGLAVDLLGLFTAAAGPLTVADLLALLSDDTGAPAVTAWQMKMFVAEHAARILEPVGPAAEGCWQFAHGSLLEYAQDPNGEFARDTEELRDPQYRQRIHRWAQHWRDAGWTATAEGRVPRYLLGEYPATLAADPSRLTALVSEVGWVDAAIQSAGVDRVLADLRSAAAADPARPTAGAMLATVSGQAHHLRPPLPVTEPGYVLRQLCLQAGELGEDRLASDLRARLRNQPDPGLIPIWTTRRTSRALSAELGRHDNAVAAVAVLADGRVVSGGDDGRVLVWDPAWPGTGPVELRGPDDAVAAVAVLGNGRVVSGGNDGRVLVWDPAEPGSDPVELGRHGIEVTAVTVLPNGRVVSGDYDGWVLLWDPAEPGSDPAELGRHDGPVRAVAVLLDGRVVSGGFDDERVLMWDPAQPGSDPVELGGHDDWVAAVAVLPDGRVVSGGADGWVLVWDPAQPGSDPVELGHHDNWVKAVAVLADGRVVSGGDDQRVLLWDSARPGSGPVELGHHDRWVAAVAVLPDGRVVSGGNDDRVLVWNATTQEQVAQLDCSVIGLAAAQASRGEASLAVVHKGQGFSLWSITKGTTISHSEYPTEPITEPKENR
jgi:WD40 repeat protein